MRLLILINILFLTGCSMLQPRPSLPTVLTSKDLQWTIPAGVEFQAIQKPAYPALTKFVVPDDDLAVLYKGSLHDADVEANNHAIKGARSAKIQGAVMGAALPTIGLLVQIVAGLLRKKKGLKIEGAIKTEG